jgi:hypothetical protein
VNQTTNFRAPPTTPSCVRPWTNNVLQPETPNNQTAPKIAAFTPRPPGSHRGRSAANKHLDIVRDWSDAAAARLHRVRTPHPEMTRDATTSPRDVKCRDSRDDAARRPAARRVIPDAHSHSMSRNCHSVCQSGGPLKMGRVLVKSNHEVACPNTWLMIRQRRRREQPQRPAARRCLVKSRSRD